MLSNNNLNNSQNNIASLVTSWKQLIIMYINWNFGIKIIICKYVYNHLINIFTWNFATSNHLV
jgi:hypothetical protein